MSGKVETPEQYAERIRNREAEDLRSILKTVYGKRFLWTVLRGCGMTSGGTFADPIRFGEPDTTAFNCGVVKTGTTLLNRIIEVRPETYSEMMKMAKEDEDVRRAIADADRDND